jgi:hypothetical protein
MRWRWQWHRRDPRQPDALRQGLAHAFHALRRARRDGCTIAFAPDDRGGDLEPAGARIPPTTALGQRRYARKRTATGGSCKECTSHRRINISSSFRTSSISPCGGMVTAGCSPALNAGGQSALHESSPVCTWSRSLSSAERLNNLRQPPRQLRHDAKRWWCFADGRKVRSRSDRPQIGADEQAALAGREKPAEAPSGLSVPAFGYPVGPTSVGRGGQMRHCAMVSSRKKVAQLFG